LSSVAFVAGEEVKGVGAEEGDRGLALEEARSILSFLAAQSRSGVRCPTKE
jgi:hypothetical protein